jgi:hypothetical protein
MVEQKIKCPKCGYEFPVSEALTHQIEEALTAKLEADFKKKEDELKVKAEQKAAKSLKFELDDLKAQVKEKDKQVSEFQKAELELREKTRELEQQKKSVDLEVARKIDSEKDKFIQEALKKADEDQRLKNREKDKKIEDLVKSLDEAQRKAQQGSMQTQGEVMELSLEDALQSAFPQDDIQPVPKGIKGADVVQKVKDKRGNLCGQIVWESKRTKSWSEPWLQKLKDDQRTISAEMAVLVSEVMPKEVESFGQMNGVWVSRFDLAIGLARALRQGLIEVSFAKRASVGKGEKMEAIYQYISGTEFRQKIEAIVETFVMMKQQLDSEKRSMERIWKERDKQIDRMSTNTVRMVGEMRGIVGASLPEIKALELKRITTPDDENVKGEKSV